jgi:hypothetical protein
MPRRLIARLVGTGLRAIGGALSGAGTVVLTFASAPDRASARRPDASGTTPPR